MTQIRPGLFGAAASADAHRHSFDVKNEVLLTKGTEIDYLFFGDSITQFWELSAYFNKPNQVIINRGVGGDTSYFASKRFMADAVQLNPKVCITLIGVNDAWELESNNWLLTPGNTLENVLVNTLANHRTMMQQAKDNNMELFVCSGLPTNMTFTNNEPERKKFVVKMNEGLQKLCEEFGYTYVDYFSSLVDEDQLSLRAGLAHDGLHPLTEGYDTMAAILTKKLLEKGYVI